ncbi:hypothetical protein Pmani_009757 [Petrolisthes manimaculis]|uniref:Death domain-containing protein n=1 Tax=Petrolisthes manimaculis TaxID=1843537 RepID=A0AAE1Q5S1_9EUCA|nr:hypothetical protein Pmani_009757 [Petrolisthes manimaculis]
MYRDYVILTFKTNIIIGIYIRMPYAELKAEICHTWMQLNEEQMARVRFTLLEAAREVGEYPHMREIYKCSDLTSALILLEKWMLLTSEKVDILLWLGEQVGFHTEMVRSLVERYKKHFLCTSTEEKERQLGKVPQNPQYSEITEYLGENLRGGWPDLGRRLGLNNLVAELLIDSSLRQKDKVYQILEKHQEQAAGDPVPAVLQALQKCGMNRQHSYIVKEILSR